jgi:WD40 repeat protein
VGVGKKLSHRLDAVAFSPDGKLILVGQQDGYRYYRDAKTLAEVKTERLGRQSIVHLVFAPDNRTLLIGPADSSNGKISVRELPTGP